MKPKNIKRCCLNCYSFEITDTTGYVKNGYIGYCRCFLGERGKVWIREDVADSNFALQCPRYTPRRINDEPNKNG